MKYNPTASGKKFIQFLALVMALSFFLDLNGSLGAKTPLLSQPMATNLVSVQPQTTENSSEVKTGKESVPLVAETAVFTNNGNETHPNCTGWMTRVMAKVPAKKCGSSKPPCTLSWKI